MKQNNYGEMIFNESDVLDLLMQGRTPESLKGMLVDESVDLERIVHFVDHFPTTFVTYTFVDDTARSVPEWDRVAQQHWQMPQGYRDLDIAKYILDLCDGDAELQRCGEELLLYQQHGLFDLLKYLKYLVDVMTANNVIWGVGRGSSVASFVLYKLKVHRIDSLYYNLPITEFLR
jgi:hypothetical protein